MPNIRDKENDFGDVNLSFILHSILSSSEKSFQDVLKYSKNSRKTRTLLMSAMCKAKARFANFLVAYRFTKSKEGNENQGYLLASQNMNGNNNNLMENFKNIWMIIRRSIPPQISALKVESNIQNCFNYSSERLVAVRKKVNLKNLDLCLHNYVSGYKVVRNKIYIKFKNEACIKLKNHKDILKLKKYKLKLPFKLDESTMEVTTKKLVYITYSSKNVIHDLYCEIQEIISKFILIYIYQQISKTQNDIFDIYFNNKTIFLTSKLSERSCKFIIQSCCDKIILMSNKSLIYSQENESLMCTEVPNDPKELDHLISKIYCLTNDYVLTYYYKLIEKAFFLFPTKYLKFKRSYNKIIFFCCGKMIIEFKIENNKLIVKQNSNIKINHNDLINSLKGSNKEKIDLIKTMIFVSLCQHVFSNKLSEKQVCEISPYFYDYFSIKLFSSENFISKFDISLNNLSINIYSLDGKFNFSYPISKNNVNQIFGILTQKILFYEIINLISKKDLLYNIYSNEIVIFFEYFENIKISVSHSYWKVTTKGISFFSIIGNSFSFRFTEWIYHLILNIRAYNLFLDQTKELFSIKNTIKNMNFFGKLNFLISSIYDECSKIMISFDSLKEISPNTFIIDSQVIPKVRSQFIPYINVNENICSLLPTYQLVFPFASFLSSRFLLLSRLRNMISNYKSPDDWTIFGLRTETSFFVVYKKKYSINFMVRTSQKFQVVLPSFSVGSFLQVPLHYFPDCQNFKSHFILNIHISKITELLKIIEKFIGLYEYLQALGFSDFKLSEDYKEVEGYLKRKNSQYLIKCYISTNDINFVYEEKKQQVSSNAFNETLKNYLNFDFGGVTKKVHTKAIFFILSVLNFDDKVAKFFLNFIKVLFKNIKYMNINWEESINLSKIIPKELVLFVLISNMGIHQLEIRDIHSDSFNVLFHSNQDAKVITSIQELNNSLEKIFKAIKKGNL